MIWRYLDEMLAVYCLFKLDIKNRDPLAWGLVVALSVIAFIELMALIQSGIGSLPIFALADFYLAFYAYNRYREKFIDLHYPKG